MINVTAQLILRKLWPDQREMPCERRAAKSFLARRSAAAARAALVVAAAFSVFLLCAQGSQAKGSSGACEEVAELSVLASPIAPWRGAPLRVLFAAEKPMEGELSLISPDGRVAATSRERRGGPPYFWLAEVASPSAGTWRAKLSTTFGRASRLRNNHPRYRCLRPPASAPAQRGKRRLAHSQRMEPGDGEFVLCLDREALRCSS